MKHHILAWGLITGSITVGIVAMGCGSDSSDSGAQGGDAGGPSASNGGNPFAGAGRSGDTSMGGSPATGGSDSGGTPSSGGSDTGGSPAGGTPSGGGPSGGSTSTGGVIGAECADDEPPTCVDDATVQTCFDGAYEQYTCTEVCETLGLEVGPCDQGCACGDLTDEPCIVSAAAVCFCIEEEGDTCDDDTAFALYVTCHVDDPPEDAAVVSCYGDHVNADNTIDCTQAATDCL